MENSQDRRQGASLTSNVLTIRDQIHKMGYEIGASAAAPIPSSLAFNKGAALRKNHPGLLSIPQLEGLAQLIQGADPAHVKAEDLVRVLEILSNGVMDTHQQTAQYMYQLTMAVSNVLDAMVDTKVVGLDREKLHDPLPSYLNEVKKKSVPFLVYQAAYAHQALLRVLDNETTGQAAMRRIWKALQGASGIVSATKGLNLNKFIEGLVNIQKGFGGPSKVVVAAKLTFDRMNSLVERSQSLMDSLKKGSAFKKGAIGILP
ncbi:MAG: hypothetical protein J3Q66DRAFT_367435 [Benniella sp.]|nr:MAG: hypothetical protein J3Q66DRAFT_367435 [Benniella sp.]